MSIHGTENAKFVQRMTSTCACPDCGAKCNQQCSDGCRDRDAAFEEAGDR